MARHADAPPPDIALPCETRSVKAALLASASVMALQRERGGHAGVAERVLAVRCPRRSKSQRRSNTSSVASEGRATRERSEHRSWIRGVGRAASHFGM